MRPKLERPRKISRNHGRSERGYKICYSLVRCIYGLGTLWLVMVVWYFNIPELAIAVSTVNLHTTHDSAPYTRLDDRSSNVLVLQHDLYRVSAS